MSNDEVILSDGSIIAKPLDTGRRSFLKKLGLIAGVAMVPQLAAAYDEHSASLADEEIAKRRLGGGDRMKDLPEFLNEHFDVIYRRLGKLEHKR